MVRRKRLWWRVPLAVIAAVSLLICAWWPNYGSSESVCRLPFGADVFVLGHVLIIVFTSDNPHELSDDERTQWTWFWWTIEFASHHMGEYNGGVLGIESDLLFNRPVLFIARRAVVVLSAALLLPIVFLLTARLRSRNWRRSGRCSGCGYFLRGLDERRCPECGTPY